MDFNTMGLLLQVLDFLQAVLRINIVKGIIIWQLVLLFYFEVQEYDNLSNT